MSLLAEYWRFLKARRKRWMFPLLLLLLLAGAFVVLLKAAAISPILYTLF